MFKPLSRLFSMDIAMDLGTANTLLYTQKQGIVINEPSVVALDIEKQAVYAVGEKAKELVGRAPENITIIRPMKDGVIADFDTTRKMISYFVRKAKAGFSFVKPSLLIAIPMGITQVERRAVVDSALQAGAGQVRLIEEPIAASIGAGHDIRDPVGHFVVVIGGGTSEVAVISLGGIVHSHSIRIAGDAMTEAIQRYVREVFRIEICENTAEHVKKELTWIVPPEKSCSLEVSGKDAVTGVPRSALVTDAHVREALRECLRAIGEAVLCTLEGTPPELSVDVSKVGLLLAGGGVLIRGLDQYLAKATHMAVTLDSDPLTTVLRGAATVMLNPGEYRYVLAN